MKILLYVGLILVVLGIASLVVPVPHTEREGIKVGNTNLGVQTSHSERASPTPRPARTDRVGGHKSREHEPRRSDQSQRACFPNHQYCAHRGRDRTQYCRRSCEKLKLLATELCVG